MKLTPFTRFEYKENDCDAVFTCEILTIGAGIYAALAWTADDGSVEMLVEKLEFMQVNLDSGCFTVTKVLDTGIA